MREMISGRRRYSTKGRVGRNSDAINQFRSSTDVLALDWKALQNPKLNIPASLKVALQSGAQAMISKDAASKSRAIQMLVALPLEMQGRSGELSFSSLWSARMCPRSAPSSRALECIYINDSSKGGTGKVLNKDMGLTASFKKGRKQLISMLDRTTQMLADWVLILASGQADNASPLDAFPKRADSKIGTR